MNTRTELKKQYLIIADSTLAVMLDRFEKHPDYGYLDTKFDLITGRDNFDNPDKAMRFRSKDFVYSWIQGRGAEALAGHLTAGINSANRIKDVLSTLCEKLYSVWQANGKRMFFMLSPEGRWLNADGSYRTEAVPGEANYSDIFVAKGMLTAASVLENKTLQNEMAVWYKQILDAIEANKFVTDQQPFDPANPVAAQEGKILQGPFMIALGGIANAATITGDEAFLDYGCRFIQRILDIHTREVDGRPEFFEAVHEDNTPWIENGRLLCDPGHTLEFIGLAQRFLFILEKADRPQDKELVERCRKFFPSLLKTTFALGYAPEAQGIIKSYDLIARKPINSDMPWWSLPETIRAAAENELFCNTDQSEIIGLCSEALWNKFTVPEHGYFAWQTRGSDGAPSVAIPAVPDLDPGYHTNLALLDTVALWQK